MPETGVRGLKSRASEIVRRVRERKVRYIITYRGRPVAILGPVEKVSPTEAGPADVSAWEELERLGEAIGKGWRSKKTTTDLLSESRR